LRIQDIYLKLKHFMLIARHPASRTRQTSAPQTPWKERKEMTKKKMIDKGPSNKYDYTVLIKSTRLYKILEGKGGEF